MKRSELERIARDAMFNAIEHTALDMNCCALQSGRIIFDGDFDADFVAQSILASLERAGVQFVYVVKANS